MRVIPHTSVKLDEWAWTCALAKDDSFALVTGANKVSLARIAFKKRKGRKQRTMTLIPGTEISVVGWVFCSALSEDSRFAVFGSDDDGTLRLAEIMRDPETQAISQMRVFPGNEIKVAAPIYSCTVSPDGSFVIFGTGGKDRKLRIANVIEDPQEKHLKLEEISDGGIAVGGEIYVCHFVENHDLIVFGSSNYKLQGAKIIRDPVTHRVLKLELERSLEIQLQGQPYCMDVSDQHGLMLVGTESERIEIFEIEENASRTQIIGFKKRSDLDFKLGIPPSLCDLARDETLLLIGSSDGKVRLAKPLFHQETKKIIRFETVASSEIDLGVRVICGHISSDKNFALVATNNDAVTRLVDLKAHAPLINKPSHRPPSVQTLESGIQQKITKRPSVKQYQEEQTMMLALQEVSEVLSGEVDLKNILTDIATIVGKAIGAKWINFWEFTPDRKGVSISAAFGMDAAYMEQTKVSPIPVGSAFIGRAVATGKPWGSSDCRTSPKTFRSLMKGVVRLNVYGLLCLPLISKGEVLGGMCIYYQTPHLFSQFELRLTTIAANQAATAVRNTQFFNELNAERNKTLAMIDSLYDGIIMYDLTDRIVSFNPRAEELLWVREKEVILKYPKNLDISTNPLLKNIRYISELSLLDFESKEITIEDPQRTHIAITFLPVKDAGNQKIGSLRVIHDVTKEKETEEFKSSFVTIASHQLRTPMSGLKWAINLLLNGEFGTLTTEGTKTFLRSAQAVESLIRLVGDLLDVSRIEEGRFKYAFGMHDLKKIVEDVSQNLVPQFATRKIEFTIRTPDTELPLAKIDPEKFKMAVSNILDNAFKYTLPGGKVTASLSTQKSSLILDIADTGIGVPKDQVKLIFTKFFRARNAIRLQTEGSGLGLWIANEIVKHHNGRIWIETKENKGTVFSIQLPRESV